MFVTNVIVGDYILDRTVFDDIRHASEYAIQQSREKVWRLDNGVVYYGNVESRVYELESFESADYKDEHILSFFGSI